MLLIDWKLFGSPNPRQKRYHYCRRISTRPSLGAGSNFQPPVWHGLLGLLHNLSRLPEPWHRKSGPTVSLMPFAFWVSLQTICTVASFWMTATTEEKVSPHPRKAKGGSDACGAEARGEILPGTASLYAHLAGVIL
jgi:hypothetical protein